MPTSSSGATSEKKKALRVVNHKSTDQPSHDSKPNTAQTEKNLLKIAPALPIKDRRTLYVRSHSTLNASSLGNLAKCQEIVNYDTVSITLHTNPDGNVFVSRTQSEKEKHPDRISLDRRGLRTVPIINGEPRLRLLSIQHNLITDLEMLTKQKLPTLVFLDIYDNQLETIKSLEYLENLRVLLMGKNRIKRIDCLENLKKLEVLDLHGNQITQISGLTSLTELKVLNLAGNQIRCVGLKDLQGLSGLQELNLRRNRLRKLLGFAETPNLLKLFVSNNDLQSVEDISSIAKSQNIKEISIDNNPILLGGDCVSFLVSYLPLLIKLNTMQITEQVRKAAMAWRRNKEATNAAFMDLTSETSLNFRREEVISNARTNWELLRSQTKCLTNNITPVDKTIKNLKPDSDFVLTSLITKPTIKANAKQLNNSIKSKTYTKLSTKVPILPDKKLNLVRTSSQDTENSQNTSSSNASINDMLKLPPILVPIINRLEQTTSETVKEGSLKRSGSLSSLGPNIDSSISSLASGSEALQSPLSSSSSSTSSSSSSSIGSRNNDDFDVENIKIGEIADVFEKNIPVEGTSQIPNKTSESPQFSTPTIETLSNLSTNSNQSTVTSVSEHSDQNSSNKSTTRSVKSAVTGRSLPVKSNIRASTAKVKKQLSPTLPKDREQGGDYLIEICGRHLNIYGQGALRFIDRTWNANKANDVNTVKFNYVNFNSVTGILTKLKHRFPNIDHFVFKETNITSIGQLNALAEVQGLVSLVVEKDGNPIWEKDWHNYAIYRLSHWGLRFINGKEISEGDVKSANDEYQSLSDLVLYSLPDVLLQPLLVRLRIDVSHGVTEQNAKKWLMTADPALRSVVSKEALQWKKGSVSQEDVVLRQKGKQHISNLLEEMSNAMNKLKILEQEWPNVMHEFVQNTLLDYSQLDLYMKHKIHELR